MPLVGIKSDSALVVDRMGNDLSSIRKRKGHRKMLRSPPSYSQPPDVFSICGTVLSVVKLLPIHPSLEMGLRESASCFTVSNSSHLQEKLVTFFFGSVFPVCGMAEVWLKMDQTFKRTETLSDSSFILRSLPAVTCPQFKQQKENSQVNRWSFAW